MRHFFCFVAAMFILSSAHAADFTRLTQGQGRLPDWSPDGNFIVFESDRVTSYEIWMIQSSGGTEQQLTFMLAHHRCPAWSHDGELIAFTSNRDHVSAIYQMTPTGANIEKITSDQNNYAYPDWSPDGSELTFSSDLPAKEGIWVVSYETRQERRLTNTMGYYPTWSPKGDKIAYMGDDANIHIVPAAGGTPVQITDDPAWERHPEWSPDARWIVYTLEQQSEERDVWIVSSEGGTPLRLTSDGSWNYEPAWSPDGSKIAFVSDRDGTSKIWIASNLPVQPIATEKSSWGKIKKMMGGLK